MGVFSHCNARAYLLYFKSPANWGTNLERHANDGVKYQNFSLYTDPSLLCSLDRAALLALPLPFDSLRHSHLPRRALPSDGRRSQLPRRASLCRPHEQQQGGGPGGTPPLFVPAALAPCCSFRTARSKDQRAGIFVMKQRIRLFPLLERFMQEIGGPNPVKTVCDLGENKKACIKIDGTKIPCEVLPYCPKPKAEEVFFGEDQENPLWAEDKAVMSVFDHLKSHYGIMVHDISSVKIVAMASEFSELKNDMDTFIPILRGFLEQYLSSIKILEPLIYGTTKNADDRMQEMISNLTDEIKGYKTKSEEFLNQMVFIQNVKSMKFPVNPFNHIMKDAMPPKLVCKLERAILSQLLKHLGIPKAEYKSKLTTNDSFLGICKLCLGDLSGPRVTGKTCIEGDEKCSPYEAECAAAARAIVYLENSKNIEIVDFNYEVFKIHMNKLEDFRILRLTCNSLLYEANKSFLKFTETVTHFINEQYHLDHGSKTEIEYAVEQAREMNYIAVSCRQKLNMLLNKRGK